MWSTTTSHNALSPTPAAVLAHRTIHSPPLPQSVRLQLSTKCLTHSPRCVPKGIPSSLHLHLRNTHLVPFLLAPALAHLLTLVSLQHRCPLRPHQGRILARVDLMGRQLGVGGTHDVAGEEPAVREDRGVGEAARVGEGYEQVLAGCAT